MRTDDAESRVTDVVEFKKVFAKLRRADAATARQIETAVRAAMQGVTFAESTTHPRSCQRIVAIKDAQLRMQELRDHYAAISAQMSEQKAYFYRTAIEAEQAFLDKIYTGLADYFGVVYDAVEKELRNDSSWMTGMLDTWHKTGGRAINWVAGKTQRFLIMATDKQSVKGFEQLIKGIGSARGEKALASAANALKSVHQWLRQHNAQKMVEERSLLERSLETVCSNSEIEKHVADIFAAAGQCYQRVWQERVKSYHAQLTTMDDAAKLAVGELHAQPVFTLGRAEQALAAGMSATIFGTAALAAGWHTLAYAMVNVFWPMAVFIAMLTAGVAWFTKDRAREERISEARRILDAYHAQLVMYVDVHKLEEHGNKSIRELVREHGLGLAQHMDDSWRQARFGKLSEEHYREMMEACERQAERLGELAGRLMQVC